VPSVLSAEQIAGYGRDGFLVLRGFVSEAACTELKRRAEALVDAFEPDEGVKSIFTTHEQTRHSDEYFLTSGDKARFFFEEEAFDADGELRQAKALSINKLGHAMHDLDPVFERFSHTAALAELCADLGYEDPTILQSMYIFKQPRIGGEVTSHTDHTFLWTEPRSVTGFWFAVEDATLENGCLWALPGGQDIPVKQRFRRDGQGGTVMEVLDDTPYPEEGLVPLEVPAGTLVVLNGTLPHRSGPNRSDRSRHAYTLHVIEQGATYPDDNWLRRRGLPLRPVA
jgi:phytanoyl-CoA hydroxylase